MAGKWDRFGESLNRSSGSGLRSMFSVPMGGGSLSIGRVGGSPQMGSNSPLGVFSPSINLPSGGGGGSGLKFQHPLSAFSKGGSVSKRADGCAKKGKTKGKMY